MLGLVWLRQFHRLGIGKGKNTFSAVLVCLLGRRQYGEGERSQCIAPEPRRGLESSQLPVADPRPRASGGQDELARHWAVRFGCGGGQAGMPLPAQHKKQTFVFICTCCSFRSATKRQARSLPPAHMSRRAASCPSTAPNRQGHAGRARAPDAVAMQKHDIKCG